MTRCRNIGIAAGLALILSNASAAADWSAQPGAARDPGRTLSVTCGGAGTAPFVATLEVAGRLLPPTDRDRSDFTLYLDNQGYRFASAFFDPAKDSWLLPVNMTDPFTAALFTTKRLLVDGGRGQAWEYQTDGLAEAVTAAFTPCIERWRTEGYEVPVAVLSLGLVKPEDASGPPPQIAAHVARGCGGGYALDPSGLQTGLIDADAETDYVLNWNDVRCETGLARPFCGAANCSVDVFLSSRGYQMREGDGLLGIAPRLVPLSNGRMGITLSGTAGACYAGACERPFWWDGVQLRQ